MNINFHWAREDWIDPETGTDVVCISPDQPLHFRNPYFRSTMFTRDGRWIVLIGEDPEGHDPPSLWCVELHSGASEKVFNFSERASLSHVAFSPQSQLLHAIDHREGHAEIVQIDLSSGEQRRILPAIEQTNMGYAECSADDRYIFSHVSMLEIPEGTSQTEQIAMLGSSSARNLMVRVDLADGSTEVVFETNWWLGHCNPNPVVPHLFMCSQEGFIWTERYPKPANYQRQHIFDFEQQDWLNLQGSMRSQGTHEHWSANGKRVYSHMPSGDLHAIYVTDLESETSTRYICPPDLGLSIHVAPAPDDSFIIGDGFNFCKADAKRMQEVGESGSGDNPWSWDGISQDSPGEIIWIYELPDETLWVGDLELSDNGAMREAIAENPDKVVKTRPLCKFRSLVKMKRETMRLESNAHVTPDSQWGVFQSCSEEGLLQVWAARVKN
jgi:hypothetical protein